MIVRIVCLAMAAAIAAPSLARPQSDDERLRDRARTFLVLRLTDALNLSDEKALEASRILKSSEERRGKLLEDREIVAKEIREGLAGDTADSARLEALIERAGQLDEQIALVPAQSFRELRKVLTVEQQAKLVLARPRIHDEIRAAMSRRMMQMRSAGDGEGAAGRRGSPDDRPRPPHQP